MELRLYFGKIFLGSYYVAWGVDLSYGYRGHVHHAGSFQRQYLMSSFYPSQTLDEITFVIFKGNQVWRSLMMLWKRREPFNQIVLPCHPATPTGRAWETFYVSTWTITKAQLYPYTVK